MGEWSGGMEFWSFGIGHSNVWKRTGCSDATLLYFQPLETSNATSTKEPIQPTAPLYR